MNNRIIIGSIVVAVSLFLAWKIGLWLEPGPAEKAAVANSSSAVKEPPFATGKVRETVTFELREVKAADDGKSVEGVGVVRFDLERADIKPAVIAILRVIKEKFPSAQRISLILTPSIDCLTCRIAEAAYDNGKVKLYYGTPTLEQMEESNRNIGAQTASGKAADRPVLVRPSGEAYSMGLDVMKAVEAARKSNPGLNDDQLLDKAAAATGLSYVVVKRHRDFMTAYYSGNAFGNEVFDM